MVSVDAWMREEKEKSEVKSPMLSKTEGHQPSAVDLAHGPSDCACVLHRRPYLRARVNRHSRNARLLHWQAWLSHVWGRGRIRRSTPSWRAPSRGFISVGPSRPQPIRKNARAIGPGSQDLYLQTFAKREYLCV